MEVKVGIQNTVRELVVDCTMTPDEVADALAKALKDGSVLVLAEEKGRRVIIPAATISYVDIAQAEARRVGFGVNSPAS